MGRKFLAFCCWLASAAVPLAAQAANDFELISDEPKELRIDLSVSTVAAVPFSMVGDMEVGLGVGLGWEEDVASLLTLGLRLDYSIFRMSGSSPLVLDSFVLSPYIVVTLFSTIERVPTRFPALTGLAPFPPFSGSDDERLRARYSVGLRLETSMRVGVAPVLFSYSPLRDTSVGIQYAFCQSVVATVDGMPLSSDFFFSVGIDLKNQAAASFRPAPRIWVKLINFGIEAYMYLTVLDAGLSYGASVGIPINLRTGLWAEDAE